MYGGMQFYHYGEDVFLFLFELLKRFFNHSFTSHIREVV